MATACGMNPDDFGGKSWRIGGATDLRDILDDAGRSQIQLRGRWGSDVAAVYQRATVDRQLAVSAEVAESTGQDMEAMFAGWVQPANIR
eukprot:5629836-Pleurochrysis_carterae.AAC.1